MRYFVPILFASFLPVLVTGCSRQDSAPRVPATPTVPATSTSEKIIAQPTMPDRPTEIAWNAFEDPNAVTYFTHHLQKIISELPATKKAVAIQRLHELLKSESLEIRLRAAEALDDLGDKGGVPTMIASFPQATGHDRDNIIVALRIMKDERTIPTLMDALKDKSPYIRGVALCALGELKAAIAYDLIVAMTDDKATKSVGDTRIVFCGNALPDPPAYCACYALGALGDQRAVPILIKLLDDEELKRSARDALDVLRKQKLQR